MVDLLIKNSIIVTVNEKRDVLFNGAIAIENDRIVDIGESESLENRYSNAKKNN